MNYFELFSLTPTYHIDTVLLAERYRELQKTVHPDKFANASEQDKRIAVQRAAHVNDGFTTLKDPLLRAEYMLSLHGIEMRHESTTIKDTQFLMQQIEWREALEDIADSTDVDVCISQLNESFSTYAKHIETELSDLLSSLSDDDLCKATDLVRKLKFMVKLRTELERIEDALFD
ncbi:co-chaperone HscB [Shewanella sp. VB17]|uniref:co-chaperone HscB n=1 Tax=Shewanella sp. VB17 TaxID=2739432 RepID=UPI00156537A5|nr:co-chaperone HscB [Shewanella sp. VB17]NRD74618.1 co-chaperone HscB [Shewanella sp. VB17]